MNQNGLLKVEPETTKLDAVTKLSMAVACLLGVLAVATSNMIIDLDLFHQMALFREMLSVGSMPLSDSFAYTPTRETVVHHEWGMGAIQYYAMVGSGMGGSGLLLLKYVLSFAICVVSYIVARRNGASFAVVIAMSPIALSLGGLIGFSNVRAQVATLLFVALQFWMFSSDKNGKRTWCLWWIPMMVAWTNIHGGVVAGVGIFLLWVACRFVVAFVDKGFGGAAREGWHRILLATLLPLLMCINPYGVAYLPYLARAVSMKRPLIGEWHSIWVAGDNGMLISFAIAMFLVATPVVLIATQARSTRKLLGPAFPIAVILLTGFLAAKHIRHVSIFAVAWICYAPGLLSAAGLQQCVVDAIGRNRRRMIKLCVGLSMLAIACCLNARFWSLSIPANAAEGSRGAPVYPVDAVDFLQKNRIGGNMMVCFGDGAYVSWRMYPLIKVSVDSRYEVAYPDGAVEESLAFFNAQPSWKETLEKYPTTLVLAPENTPIKKVMVDAIQADSIPWKLIYADESFTVFQKAEIKSH